MIRFITFTLAALFAAGAVCAQGLDGRLKKIADTKTINVAVRSDAEPFAFVDANKQPVGFSIDLCKRVVNSIERQINVQGLKINWVPVTVQTRFDAVVKGQADMECGSSTVTLTRLKQVDFSSFIFLQTTSLIVNASAGLRSLSDMSGKKIGAIAGTTNEQAVNKQIKARQINATVVPFKTVDEAAAALEGGKIDAFASDQLLLLGAAGKFKDPKKFALLPDELSFEPYGIALPRGDSALRLAINTGLSQIYSSGEIGEIYGRWFAALGPPPPAVQMVYLFGAIPE